MRFLRRALFVCGVAMLTPITRPLASQTAAAAPPLTLSTVLESIRSHPLSRAAESRVRAARGSRTTAGTFGNPVVSYQVDQTPFPGAQSLPPQIEREAMTTATLPLEYLFQRGPRVSRANAEVRTAEADATATRLRLGLDAASAFYRVGLAQIRVETTRDLLGWLDTLVAYNRARVEEGVVAEADVIRSGLERDRAAAVAAMQEAELAQARAALGAFVGGAGARVEVQFGDVPLPLPGVGESSANRAPPSIDARPDVRAARERVASSKAAVASERSMVLRQLGATIGTMQTGPTTSMIAGISLPVPLFDQNRGEIQRASAEQDAATFELAAQERTATADLRGAYEAARILTAQATVLARQDSASFLARAEESRRIALGAYREGAVPLFQVIDAARAWAEARMTYYETIVAQHQSVLSVLAAEGRDLLTMFPSTTSGGDPRR
jgi:cobalt-zinc-cadmium efflux system outer membrane protein